MLSSTVRRRRWFTLPGAVLLTFALVGQAAALAWGPPKALTTGTDVYFADLATAGGTALAVYAETDGEVSSIFARRSTDSGNTWKSPVLLANGIWPSVAGRGSNFDVVWRAPSGRLRYARSTDSGATFSAPVALTALGRYVSVPTVARGPNGVVAVAWEDVASGAIKVRVSVNGGVSFAPASTLSTAGEESGTAVAVGDGVIYVAYFAGSERIRIKRSFDGGASWSAAAVVTDNAWLSGVSLTAAGTRAYVAYTGPNTDTNIFRARYRATTDNGATWSSARALGPKTWTTYDPDISLQGGVARAAFTRCDFDFDVCVNERVYYRQQQIGSSWTAPERVSPTTLGEARTPRVGYTGKALVLYLGDFLPYVRAGSQ